MTIKGHDLTLKASDPWEVNQAKLDKLGLGESAGPHIKAKFESGQADTFTFATQEEVEEENEEAMREIAEFLDSDEFPPNVKRKRVLH